MSWLTSRLATFSFCSPCSRPPLVLTFKGPYITPVSLPGFALVSRWVCHLNLRENVNWVILTLWPLLLLADHLSLTTHCTSQKYNGRMYEDSLGRALSGSSKSDGHHLACRLRCHLLIISPAVTLEILASTIVVLKSMTLSVWFLRGSRQPVDRNNGNQRAEANWSYCCLHSVTPLVSMSATAAG